MRCVTSWPRGDGYTSAWGAPMAHCFRIRFNLPEQLRIGVDSSRWLLTPPEIGLAVTLNAASPSDLIKDSRSLVLLGEGFNTAEDATSAAERWRDAMMLSFSRLRIGADFGERAAQRGVTEAGLTKLQQDSGIRFLNDAHGLMIFTCEPPPQFVKTSAHAVLTKGQETLADAVHFAVSEGLRLLPRERLAFELFAGSFFQPSPDARFLMLMMAVETLIDSAPRAEDVQTHVHELIRLTEESKLSAAEKCSIVGSLEWLRQESIGQAGRRLATRLGKRNYMDKKPKDFFTACYELRSRLVHGYVPRPSYNEVNLIVGPLREFVGDLLSGPLIERVAE